MDELENLKDMLRVMFNRCRALWSAEGIMCLHCGLRKECNKMHGEKGGENQNGRQL